MITVNEAIRVLGVCSKTSQLKDGSAASSVILAAVKLGIEALKRVKSNRTYYPEPVVYPLLPGETKE